MVEQFRLSQRRACSLVNVSRTVMCYKSWPNVLNDRIRQRLKELAEKHRRYGHIRLYVLIRREGFIVNHKRTERIYRAEGLSLRIRRRRKFAAVTRNPLPPATKQNERWAMDFIQDSLWSGRKFRTLSIVDTYSRECLTVEADTSLPGHRVVRVLDRLADSRQGLPESIRVDNGPEFISKVLDEWAYRNGVKLDFIRPGKPTENCYAESFHGRFRDEFLNENYFLDMREAKDKIEEWRIEYN
ncbi:MAG: IS3 family transposase, partial [Candidatus Omnitrophica bacterium]|nr:IS3 family transposase [Candidatus Omnitrophota bacterium]